MQLPHRVLQCVFISSDTLSALVSCSSDSSLWQQAMHPNHRFQPTYLPSLRFGKYAAEAGALGAMKQTAMQRFLPNERNRRMFPGFICFVVAAVGVALGFTASALQVRALSIAALIITAAGVAGGVLFVASGFRSFSFRSSNSRGREP